MAVAVHEAATQQAPVTEVDRVLGGVAAQFAAQRETVSEMPLAELIGSSGAAGSVRSVVATGLRTIEVVVDDGLDPSALSAAAWQLTGSGWDVVVLLPLERLGEGHTALRGVPCRLQGWWHDDGVISFTGPETP